MASNDPMRTIGRRVYAKAHHVTALAPGESPVRSLEDRLGHSKLIGYSTPLSSKFHHQGRTLILHVYRPISLHCLAYTFKHSNLNLL